MSQISTNTSEIQDYLRGFGRHGGLAEIEAIDNKAWAALAAQVLAKRQQERATSLLSLFSENCLAAIAKGQIELTDQIAAAKFKASQ